MWEVLVWELLLPGPYLGSHGNKIFYSLLNQIRETDELKQDGGQESV